MRFFSPRPSESRTQINKAGQIIAGRIGAKDENERDWAFSLAKRWRAAHAYPINTFQSTLRKTLKDYSNEPIAAQRLKRMSTMVDKLKSREQSMQLTTMQDIGGVRAILGSLDDVYRLVDEYKKRKWPHQLYKEKDHIQLPRDADGYRSFHLMYKYKNTRQPNYDGLSIELQIRTKLQHIWATGVETVGFFRGEALKSRQGSQDWLDFFTLISSAFAYKEGTNPIARFSNLSYSETLNEIRRKESELNALDFLKGMPVAAAQISQRQNRENTSHFHLIILNRERKMVAIKPYRRDDFERANTDYGSAEEQAKEGQPIEPVLVAAGKIRELRQAYPNFFLDIAQFVTKLKEIMVEQ